MFIAIGLSANLSVVSMDGVHTFLDNINMGKYWSIFKTKGYDREDDITCLDDDDLDQLNIASEDRKTLLESGRHIQVRLLDTIEYTTVVTDTPGVSPPAIHTTSVISI